MKSWENWAVIAAGWAVLFFGTGNYWSATWLSKWALILGLFVCLISFWSAKKTSLFYLPLMLYSGLSLTYLAAWPDQGFTEPFDQVTMLALQKNALYGLMVWTGTVLGFASITKKLAEGILILLASIWAIGTTATILQPWSGPWSSPNQGMWFGNPSMGASLLACLLPFVVALANGHLKNRKAFLLTSVATWLWTLLAIYKTQASVPWGVLGVVTASLFVSQKLRSWRWTFIAIASLCAIMIWSGTKLIGTAFFDQNGRFEIWSMAWKYFWEHANPAFGFGYASTQVMLPVEQVFLGQFKGDYFLWLHNDWLQLAIEGGWVGMICVFLALSRLLVVSFRKSALFASLCGFVTLACFNYPLRMPIHMMCLVLVCGIAEAYAVKKPVIARETWLRWQRTIAEKSRLKPLSPKDLAGLRSCSQSLGPNKSR